EARSAYDLGRITLRQPIIVKLDSGIKETTIGRITFNEILPEDMDYVNEEVKASSIVDIITRAMVSYDEETVAKLIDGIKSIGFTSATTSGISVSTFDLN